jgi:hypothetical protein
MFAVPVLLIEIHFYGHWLMGGCNRQLSAIANPTTQISVIGNFIGATAFAMAGWKDLGMFFFSVGWVHYLQPLKDEGLGQLEHFNMCYKSMFSKVILED